MKIFLDAEFMEDGATCTLVPLSFAFMTLNGDALYLVITDADRSAANPFVVEHVLPYLDVPPTEKFHPSTAKNLDRTIGKVTYVRAQRNRASGAIQQWVAERCKYPEFWAWYADYDWVAFCQLHGNMTDLPDGWPKFCRDFRQHVDGKRIDFPDAVPLRFPHLPEHHCLADVDKLRARYRWWTGAVASRERAS